MPPLLSTHPHVRNTRLARRGPDDAGTSTRPSRDEDHLAARPVWRLAHLVDNVARGTQRSSHLVPVAKAQRGVRGQHRTIGLEDDGRAERDQLTADLEQLVSGLDTADPGHDGALA